jgi:hypothetical protein
VKVRLLIGAMLVLVLVLGIVATGSTANTSGPTIR